MALTSIQYRGEKFDVSYELLNPLATEAIVFLHGWGSSKTLMKQAFGKTLPNFRHVYVDLPGFGGSNAPVPLITADYAQIMKLFLEAIAITPRIILGHSFGGKVATLLNPPCLVLVASAGILVPKPLSVRFKIALFKLLKFTGLTSLRSLFISSDAKGMSEVMYQTFKNVVNEDFSEFFSRYQGKALLCFGKNDTATPLWAGEKIASLIGDSRLVAYNGDHYFLFQQGSLIADEIEKCLKDNS